MVSHSKIDDWACRSLSCIYSRKWESRYFQCLQVYTAQAQCVCENFCFLLEESRKDDLRDDNIWSALKQHFYFAYKQSLCIIRSIISKDRESYNSTYSQKTMKVGFSPARPSPARGPRQADPPDSPPRHRRAGGVPWGGGDGRAGPTHRRAKMPNLGAALNCARRSTQSDRVFFRFRRDPARCRKWWRIVGVQT